MGKGSGDTAAGMDAQEAQQQQEELLQRFLAPVEVANGGQGGEQGGGKGGEDAKERGGGGGGTGLKMVLLFCLLDTMVISVQLPALPQIFKLHGMDLAEQGWTGSAYSVLNFLVVPFLCRISDRRGRVGLLKLSTIGGLLGSVAQVAFTGSSMSSGMAKCLFVAGRVLPACLKSSVPVAQAYVIDVSSEDQSIRSKNLGILGASFGAAFVFGPLLGGYCAGRDPMWAIWLSGLISLLSFVVLLFVKEPRPSTAAPKSDAGASGAGVATTAAGGGAAARTSTNLESLEEERVEDSARGGAAGTTSSSSTTTTTAAAAAAAAGGAAAGAPSAWKVLTGATGPTLCFHLHNRFALYTAQHMYHTLFVPILNNQVGVTGADVGVLLAIMGLVAVFGQGLLIPSLTKRMSIKKVQVLSLVAMMMGYAAWGGVSTYSAALQVATVLTLAGGVYLNTSKSSISATAPTDAMGMVMGLSGSLDTISNAMAGPLAGALFEAKGAAVTLCVCACLAGYAAAAIVLSSLGFTAKSSSSSSSSSGSSGTPKAKDRGSKRDGHSSEAYQTPGGSGGSSSSSNGPSSSSGPSSGGLLRRNRSGSSSKYDAKKTG